VLLDSDQREGAGCFSFFLLRKVLFGFSEGAPPGRCRRVHSHRFSHEFPEDPPILPIDSAIEPFLLWFRCTTAPAIWRTRSPRKCAGSRSRVSAIWRNRSSAVPEEK